MWSEGFIEHQWIRATGPEDDAVSLQLGHVSHGHFSIGEVREVEREMGKENGNEAKCHR